MGRACCVPQCKSGKKVPSHKFPKSPIRCLEWIKSLNLDHLKSMCADELQKFKVCYMHFREEDYYSPHPHYHRLLMNTAIPSLLVYSNDSTDVKTENNVQQQPLQYFLNEDKQHNKDSQSMVTNTLFLQEQVHKQLSKQQVLLEICDEQQMEIKTEVPEVQQKINEKGTIEKNQLQQLHCEQKDNKKQQENVIYNLEKRLQRIEEQLTIMATPITNGSRRRSNLKHITRAKSLSPTARMLYNTVIKLRRSNNRLKRLIKQEKQKHKMKVLKH
ncbi:PREDICTED: 52 kDa repressor of the inhibitor of the protein kinase-like [Atta cephalotes]|uniref:THAP-type domain-containing protein n=1 Tax=Atta cephalotes TaxID=12957 RepID=A0A158NX86_ATTCE|nr:PREDICTED: 52 kDa repressor of the inhibitor of the protein kinase-like [Atta cephalotes]